MGKMKNAVLEFDLSKYSKDKPEDREQAWTTSINLTQRHKRFLESKNLNFSELVRDFLDGIMKDDISS